MGSQVEIKGFDDFAKFTENIDPIGPPVVFYFSGSKTADGNSWCPDCVEAEPIVKAFLSELKKDVIFVYVDVGNREYWKDRACPFRTDSRSKLMVIPTLIKWESKGWRAASVDSGSCCKCCLKMMIELLICLP